jgi:hypothetical protein
VVTPKAVLVLFDSWNPEYDGEVSQKVVTPKAVSRSGKYNDILPSILGS